MFAPPNRSLRRLKLEELLSKTEQIEEQVSLTSVSTARPYA